jgi:anti-anti-sigma regulatory factor
VKTRTDPSDSTLDDSAAVVVRLWRDWTNSPLLGHVMSLNVQATNVPTPAELSLSIDSEQIDEQCVRIRVSGTIDEQADLSAMVSAAVGPEIVLDLGGVRRINSVGVGEWIRAVHRISPDVTVWWENTSVAMVQQLTMIANFQGNGRIRSLMAPYYCRTCESEHAVTISRDGINAASAVSIIDQACPECAELMELDEIEPDFVELLADLFPTIENG